MEISFIIPVYNGEKDIENCVSSIREGNWKAEFEIILINDGSLDKTGEICDSLAKEDERIRVIHTENRGQGAARNEGLAAARGNYIFFADADDLVNAGLLIRLWETAEEKNADVVMGGYFRVGNAEREQISLPGEGRISRKGTKEQIKLYHRVMAQSCFGYLWNKIYRRSFLKEKNLRFHEMKKVFMEDYTFNMKVWSFDPVFWCIDLPVYFYRVDNISTTRKKDPELAGKSIRMIEEITEYLEEKEKLDENMDILIPLVVRTFCWTLFKSMADGERKRSCLKHTAELFAKNRKVNMLASKKQSAGQLGHLPSFLQRIFYRMILAALRRKNTGIPVLLFQISYPVMKIYVVHMVK